jgi:polysaccharide deacetylase family protein (PEP-CTERM system associated)
MAPVLAPASTLRSRVPAGGTLGRSESGESVHAHHFTVDVEEYFQVSALEGAVTRADWEVLPSRVLESTRRLAELLAAAGSRGTWFVLGWIAARHPDLVKELTAAGHEIASHGWDHRRVTSQSKDEFRESVRRTRLLLEDQTGEAVYGFRAPSYSIVPRREWALDVLVEEGYRYDSSLFPVRRSGYGFPGGRRDVHVLERRAGPLIEVPPATLRLGGVNLPAGGGGWFRLLPSWLTRSALRQAERRGAPATFYIHPWEIDAGQPRMQVSLLTRIRHYGRLRQTEARLERLVREFRFQPIAETLGLRRDAEVPS